MGYLYMSRSMSGLDNDVKENTINTFTKLNTFNNVAPKTAVAPTSNDDIANKLYVDNNSGGGGGDNTHTQSLSFNVGTGSFSLDQGTSGTPSTPITTTLDGRYAKLTGSNTISASNAFTNSTNTFNLHRPTSVIDPASSAPSDTDFITKNDGDTLYSNNAGDVTLAGTNVFTGTNKFDTNRPTSIINPASSAPSDTDFITKNDGDTLYNNNAGDVTLAGTNVFTGTNKFDTNRPSSTISAGVGLSAADFITKNDGDGLYTNNTGDVTLAGTNAFTGTNKFDTNRPSSTINAGVGLSATDFITKNDGDSLYGSGSGDVTQAGNNDFTGTNKFDTNRPTSTLDTTPSSGDFITRADGDKRYHLAYVQVVRQNTQTFTNHSSLTNRKILETAIIPNLSNPHFLIQAVVNFSYSSDNRPGQIFLLRSNNNGVSYSQIASGSIGVPVPDPPKDIGSTQSFNLSSGGAGYGYQGTSGICCAVINFIDLFSTSSVLDGTVKYIVSGAILPGNSGNNRYMFINTNEASNDDKGYYISTLQVFELPNNN